MWQRCTADGLGSVIGPIQAVAKIRVRIGIAPLIPEPILTKSQVRVQ